MTVELQTHKAAKVGVLVVAAGAVAASMAGTRTTSAPPEPSPSPCLSRIRQIEHRRDEGDVLGAFSVLVAAAREAELSCSDEEERQLKSLSLLLQRDKARLMEECARSIRDGTALSGQCEELRRMTKRR